MRRGALFFALGLPAAVGCAGLIGADFDAHRITDTSEGGVDAQVDAGGGDGAPTTCVHAEPPPNKVPGQNLGGTTDVWTAIYSVDYGDGDGVPSAATYSSIGYDLDRVCTSLGDPATCVQAKHAPKDGVGGRDNAAGELIFEVKSTYKIIADPIGSKNDTKSIQSGLFSVLFHISGYNGQPDDDQVRFEWYLPAQFGSDNDGGAKAPPAWNGTDTWPLRKDGTLTLADGGAGPLVSDDNAYVAGGVVVASLPKGSRISGGSIEFDLSGVFVTANIVKTPQGFELQGGTLAGTWGQAQVLGGLGQLFKLVGKCADFPIYQQLKSLVCGALDVSGSGVPLPTQACDALSIGMAFVSKPVRPPATVLDVPLGSTPCPPATDPVNDACFKDSGAGGG